MAVALYSIENSTEGRIEVPPFSLLHNTKATGALRHEASLQCGVEEFSIDDIYPCTPFQGGLFATSQKTTAAYIAHLVFTIPASININQFIAAWQVVAQEFAILHTRLIQSSSFESDLIQVVLKAHLSWSTTREALETYLERGYSEAFRVRPAIIISSRNHH